MLTVIVAASVGCETKQSDNDESEERQSKLEVEKAPNSTPRSPGTVQKRQTKPTEKKNQPATDSALETAFRAPDDAVTSSGRFAELEEKFGDKMPEVGLLYASAGADQLTLLFTVDSQGHVEWSRGTSTNWDGLDQAGDFDLAPRERRRLAKMVDQSWTIEADYPPSSANQMRLVVVRSRGAVRVFEHSSVPDHLDGLRDMIVARLPAGM